MIVDDAEHSTPDEGQGSSRAARYAYMRRDGTLDIIIGSLIAGVGSYAFQFIAGKSDGIASLSNSSKPWRA